MALFEIHRNKLILKYGLPEEQVRCLEESGMVSSLSPSEVRNHLERTDIDSSGFLLRYPGNEATTIRLDDPPIKNGKSKKYLRKSGEINHLFNPGVDLAKATELWVVEGELKALCGHAHGLNIVGISGVYNWRTEGEEAAILADGEKLKDNEALLPELSEVDWSDKKVTLLYDSDIIPTHKAYPAYERLAEQLYRLGAEEVKILSLPSLAQGQKTGLDEFILARKERALADLQAMKDRKEPYLPTRSGALTYAERLIKSQDLEDKLNATVAYLGAKGKVFALEWLKEQGLKGDTKSALLQEAREKLSQLQLKPKSSSSQETLSELGPEYDAPKNLLKDHIDYFDIDSLGRLSKIVWQETTSGGKQALERAICPLCNFVVWPLRDILKDNGLTTKRFIEFQGLHQGGAPFKPVKISSKSFQEMHWLIEAWAYELQ